MLEGEKRLKEKAKFIPFVLIPCVPLLWGHNIPDNDFNNGEWVSAEVGRT